MVEDISEQFLRGTVAGEMREDGGFWRKREGWLRVMEMAALGKEGGGGGWSPCSASPSWGRSCSDATTGLDSPHNDSENYKTWIGQVCVQKRTLIVLGRFEHIKQLSQFTVTFASSVFVSRLGDRLLVGRPLGCNCATSTDSTRLLRPNRNGFTSTTGCCLLSLLIFWYFLFFRFLASGLFLHQHIRQLKPMTFRTDHAPRNTGSCL
jgi:hypothetical protein